MVTNRRNFAENAVEHFYKSFIFDVFYLQDWSAVVVTKVTLKSTLKLSLT